MASKEFKALEHKDSDNHDTSSTVRVFGLTTEGKVDPALIDGSGHFGYLFRTIATEGASISRPLDWINGPQDLVTRKQRYTALGQQFGAVAPKGEECGHCHKDGGIFKSCVIFTYNLTGVPTVIFGGSCMNCRWLGVRCHGYARFKDDGGPAWLRKHMETMPCLPPPNVLSAFSKKRKAIEISVDAPASKAGRKDDESSKNTPSLTGPQYDRAWYTSPLDDPSVGSRNNYHEKRVALHSLKSAKDRIDHDIAKVARFLTMTGHIDSSSDDESDSGAENVFAGFKLMKMGPETEQEEEEEEKEDHQDNDMEGEEQDEE